MESDFVVYLEGVKAKMGFKNDRALAVAVGMNASALCNVMKGLGVPSDDACVRIAQVAGDAPARVLLLAHRTRSRGDAKAAWDKLYRALANVALAAAFALGLSGLLPSPAPAPADIGGYSRYIM